jgi:hypothetical protein
MFRFEVDEVKKDEKKMHYPCLRCPEAAPSSSFSPEA